MQRLKPFLIRRDQSCQARDTLATSLVICKNLLHIQTIFRRSSTQHDMESIESLREAEFGEPSIRRRAGPDNLEDSRAEPSKDLQNERKHSVRQRRSKSTKTPKARSSSDALDKKRSGKYHLTLMLYMHVSLYIQPICNIDIAAYPNTLAPF